VIIIKTVTREGQVLQSGGGGHTVLGAIGDGDFRGGPVEDDKVVTSVSRTLAYELKVKLCPSGESSFVRVRWL